MDPEEELSLDDDIGAAIDEQLDGSPDDVATEAEHAREYVREGRRFVPKEAKEPKPGKQPAEVVADAAVTPEQQQQPKVWKPVWYKDEYGPWDKLGENFRNALREQERNASQAIEKHSTAAKQWEPLAKVIEPYREQMRQAGIEPAQYFQGLMQHDLMLRDPDPVKKIDALDAIAQAVGLDLVQVGQWLAQNGSAPQPDPRDQKLQMLEQRLQQFETRGMQEQKQALESQIQAWAKDKPHFAEVRSYMAALAKVNPEASLDQLYEAAQLAHPEVRARILEDKRKQELNRARSGTLPRGAPSPGATTRGKPIMSLEEEIGATFDALSG